MSTETAAKKNTQRLQRAIADGLENVKAQDIEVFNTEHLSPLFERVIVASGTSNRQTKALAASVRDSVRDAGFGKPRVEGEDNGEWIIVDCGAAVVHIMQPAIRQYYRLEEIWGDKPVRLKFAAPVKPAVASSRSHVKPATKAVAKSAAKPAAKVATSKTPAAKKTAGGKSSASTKTVAVKKTAAQAPAAKKVAAKKPAAKSVTSVSKPKPKTSGGVR